MSEDLTNGVDPYEMRHFIWVRTVCESTRLAVSVKLLLISQKWVFSRRSFFQRCNCVYLIYIFLCLFVVYVLSKDTIDAIHV